MYCIARRANTVFAVVAFAQSAVWLAEVADEVVAVLGAAGAVLAIDEDLLGATVLAWGETLPDLFAMLAVARAGPTLTAHLHLCTFDLYKKRKTPCRPRRSGADKSIALFYICDGTIAVAAIGVGLACLWV